MPKAGNAGADGYRWSGLALAAPGLIGIVAGLAIQPPEAAADARVQAARLPLPPANGALGFLLTRFSSVSARVGPEHCPNGFGLTLREAYLATQAETERTRLRLRENEAELEQRWKAYAVGPNGTNICTHADQFDRPPNPTLEARTGPGMDLDGDAVGRGGGDTCAHANFAGLDGAQGVDNQAWRALACSGGPREAPVAGMEDEGRAAMNEKLRNGEHTMVLLVRGIDSLVDDDKVEVIFASSSDVAVTDTRRNVITGASFTVTDNPRWRNVLTGRIVGGVLVTDPAELRTSQKWGHGGIRGQRAEYVFHKGRFRLAFQPDGSVKGMLGGYQPIRTMMQVTMLGGIGAAVTAGINCAGTYATLRKMADGVKDPATGKCTALSSALEVQAVPAFVFDAPAKGSKRIATR